MKLIKVFSRTMIKIYEIDTSFHSNNDENLNDLPSEINYSEGKNRYYENYVSFPCDNVTVTTAINTEPCDSSVTSTVKRP